MRRVGLLVSAGLVVLTTCAYGPLWDNGFINLDDEGAISENPYVAGGITPSDVHWAWTTFLSGNWIPLTWMSLQLDASLSPGPDPAAGTAPSAVVCHAQNLFWHTATVVLLFCTLRRLTGAVWCSALVAALFAVHPLHVESVAWATERKDVLSAFFLVLTVFAYARYAERPSAGRYLVVFGSFVLGLLAKPMLVTLPIALLLLDYWPLRRWPVAAQGPGAATGRRGVPRPGAVSGPGWLVLEKVPLLVVAAADSAIAVLAQRSSHAVETLANVTLGSRVANAVVSYGWYLDKTFWPTGLALFYPHPHADWAWGPVLGWGAALLAVTAAVLAGARRRPWLAVGWLWFVGTLVPVIGLVQIGGQAHADRYAYVPHIGLFVAVVWGAAALRARLGVPAAVGVLAAGAWLATLAALTWVQLGYWRDARTVWEHALAVDAANARARQDLARDLFKQAQRLAGRGWAEKDPALLDRSQENYAQAVQVHPDDVALRQNFALLLTGRGEFAAAAEQFEAAAARLVPKPTDDRQGLALARLRAGLVWHNLGVVRLRLGQAVLAEQAFRRALACNPPAANTRAQQGTALWEQGRHAEAVAAWEEARRAEPHEPEALTGLAREQLRQGQPGPAAALLEAAIKGEPSPLRWSLLGVARGRAGQGPQAVEAHTRAVRDEEARGRLLARPAPADLALYTRRLAHALWAAGRADDAAGAYARALALEPGWRQAAAQRAWRLATDADPGRRDPAEALELAEQACQAQGDPSAAALDVLAAAQAATGHYDEAAVTARRALAKAPPPPPKAIEARLKLYEQRKPYVAGKE
jgi:tetratricopeptide (TPR) repeat protein